MTRVNDGENDLSLSKRLMTIFFIIVTYSIGEINRSSGLLDLLSLYVLTYSVSSVSRYGNQ